MVRVDFLCIRFLFPSIVNCTHWILFLGGFYNKCYWVLLKSLAKFIYTLYTATVNSPSKETSLIGSFICIYCLAKCAPPVRWIFRFIKRTRDLKWISTPRNLFLRWISWIFFFAVLLGSLKKICKPVSIKSGIFLLIIRHVPARLLCFRTVCQSPSCPYFPKTVKKENPRTDLSQLKPIIRFHVLLLIPDIKI